MMELNDLLVSYNQVRVPDRVVENLTIPKLDQITPTPFIQQTQEKVEEQKEEEPSYYISSNIKAPGFPKIKGSTEFEQAYDEVEKTNPEARKYRAFLTRMAQKESGFNKSIQNRAGAPAYGYFQFMQDGKKYNNISKYAGTDIETFRNNPKLQIEAAIKLAKSFEKGFSKEDRELAKKQGFTTFGLLGGAWLAGNEGVRKFLKGQGNPSDRHWSKEGKGTSVADRIREFNFRKGGIIRKRFIPKGQKGIKYIGGYDRLV